MDNAQGQDDPTISPQQLEQLNEEGEREDRRRFHKEQAERMEHYLANLRPVAEWFPLRLPNRVSFLGAMMAMTLSIFLILVAVGFVALMSWAGTQEQPRNSNWLREIWSRALKFYYFY